MREYAYHPTLDYLLQTKYYNDGSSLSETDNWTYDVAGNRTDPGASFDPLNRMGTHGNRSFTHDAVGNRLSEIVGGNVQRTFGWDSSNRLRTLVYPNIQTGTGMIVGLGAANYTYLPNGLRCTKVWDSTIEAENPGNEEPVLSSFFDNNTLVNDTTVRYRYDGQMTLEEDVTFNDGVNEYTDQTSYLLGGRGIEMITAQRMNGPVPSSLTVPKSSFPIYDGHGNMIATLAKDGTGYTLANEKKYDVWGTVRSSSGAGSHIVNPNKQYCARFAHTWDGESGFLYMRARYYEPTTGRFISEDPAGDGANWYIYAANNPVVLADRTGLFVELMLSMFLEDMLQAKNAAATQAAQHWAKDKILDMMAKKFGQVVGALMSEEIDFRIAHAQIDKNGYLTIATHGANGGVGQRFGFDFGPYGVGKHGGPHIDVLDGAAQKALKLYGGTRFHLFIEGLQESLLH